MPKIDGSSKPPQIYEMFQKFALAFKAKTFEFFANEEAKDADGLSLLDSAEEVITDQKVVVIKLDSAQNLSQLQQTDKKFNLNKTQLREEKRLEKNEVFEPNPFVEDSIKAADRALVSHLQRLLEFKRFYVDFCRNTEFDYDLPIGKLRTIGTISNRLQVEIDQKDNEVVALRKKLDEIHKSNLKLSKRLSGNLGSSCDVLLSIKVFDLLLHDACRLAHKKAGWDLDLAVNLVHPNIDYAKKAHYRYAFLSYVSLGIFRGFNSKHFGESENGALSNGHVSDSDKKSTSLKQLLEHVSSNPLELLSREPSCDFSKFCESKYQEIIHPKVCFLTIKAKVVNGSIVYFLIFGGCSGVDD
ncbi:hypothetical protein UlMin_013600 [Ulmus minor]